jgi:transcription-repair coupling factor (superfamily II helicase)
MVPFWSLPMLLSSLPSGAGSRIRYGELHGSSDALAAAQLGLALRNEKKLLVVVCASALEAQRLADEIAFFAPELNIHFFPDWETLPYDSFSPHQDLVSERLATLYEVMHHGCDVLLTPVATALYRLPPVQYLAAYTFFLKQGERLDLPALRSQLTLAGYSHVTQVVSPGEYSFRGGLIDLFPMGSPLPYRIDLFDDEVESIRVFDSDTQRSLYPVQQIRLLPAREFPQDDDGRTRFRERYRDRFEGDPSKSPLYKSVSNGLAPAGIEYYLPLFFDETATLFEYFSADTTLCLHHDVAQAAQVFWRDTRSRYELLKGDPARPVLSPEELFLTVDQFFGLMKNLGRIDVMPPTSGETTQASKIESCATAPLPLVEVERRAENPLAKLKDFLERFDGRVFVLAESPGRRETMLDSFREYGLQPVSVQSYAAALASSERFLLGVAPLHAGFILREEKLALITETELYVSRPRPRVRREVAARKSSVDAMLRDLSEVRIGDPVVHESHGIGRYLGLANLDLGEGVTEFLTLEYEGGDKLYVPVSQLHLVSRYSGANPEATPLHKLGSGQWDKAKRRAAKQARDTAAELLHLYAQRAARAGHAFDYNLHDYEAFAEGFAFQETPDQAAAISNVIIDLRNGRPMDRLICGDVGFGKTEVALRAAFVAVSDGKQAAVLVPTTLLAEQHFQVFSDRFADWPVKIAELSRFRSSKEQAAALAGLASGSIDIVIGTHRLLQKDVKFERLGLVIVDEEHRFGVRQKERLKSLRAEVDVLTLTATPIPRTLAMSLEGIRDFSVIATAPERRLAIKTFVSPYSAPLIREAVLRELKRGGQIYFLHNEIETIYGIEEKLQKLIPEASVRVAHGQMPERELERAMRDFYQQRFNLLLCTTIIETGIDVPSANTMIINRADRFGLAQLHQLRGRVGRSHHQAYAYLLTPDEEALTAQAKKRLEAIKNMEELGAGFYLAMHDLEIRGAGEVLGEAQSGEMQEVGFNLYTDMLNAAVRALKNGTEPDLLQPLGITTEVNLHAPALLPDTFVRDVHERLALYKRLAHCESLEELDAMHEELVDRFGKTPDATRSLIDSHRLRILSRPLGIKHIDAAADAIALTFVPHPPIDGAKIIELVQTNKNYRLSGPDRLRIAGAHPDLGARVTAVRQILKELAPAKQERVLH